MDIRPYQDPIAFQQAALPFYSAQEARYCVSIGVVSALAADPKKWKFYAACVEQNGKVIGAFLMTPPHPLLLTGMPEDALAKVADYFASLKQLPTGVAGGSEASDAFQQIWCQRSGAKVADLVRQGIFQLDDVNPPAPAPGKMVVASELHFDLLLKWNRAFIKDCGMSEEHDPAAEKMVVDSLIREKSRYLWVVDDNPVAMAGASGKTPNGIRVNWVYTPDPLRGNGYASNLVSKLSQDLLAAGNRFCFLYTDLSNPTSNSIYQKIGYRRVGDSCHYKFAY